MTRLLSLTVVAAAASVIAPAQPTVTAAPNTACGALVSLDLPDGSEVVRDDIRGPASDAESLGKTLADRLLAQGAEAILRDLGMFH